MGFPGDDVSYKVRIEQYREVEEVHNLPAIAHYWADKHLKPRLASFGFDSSQAFFLKYAALVCSQKPNQTCYFISIGSGNCEVEVELAVALRAKGHENFVMECLDLNPAMLERGRHLAEQRNVADHLRFTVADINAWQAVRTYDLVIAYMSLHHFVELELLFGKIDEALAEDGFFVTHDMIGRNGHMRWPEVLEIMEMLWARLPEKYKYNHQLKRLERSFVNWDCSKEGFEGIRAQDILPLLLDRFHFDLFVAWGGLTDLFVDRGFGPNFDSDNDEDRAFIDEVQALNEVKILEGTIKPTQMIAAMTKHPVEQPQLDRGLTPAFCLRPPDDGKTMPYTIDTMNRTLRNVLPDTLVEWARQAKGTLTASATPSDGAAEDVGHQIAQLLQPLVSSGAYHQYFDLWEEQGFHVTRNHFYDPLPDTRSLPASLWETASPLAGIDMNEATQLHLLHEAFPAFAEEYNAFPHKNSGGSHQYYFENNFFGGTDALVLYAMIRHFRPRRVIEVGSGFSTLVITQAAQHNDATDVVCIEPYPQEFLKKGMPGISKLVETTVQAVDMDVFRQLQEGDILFIDSSHVSKIGSDVNHLFFEVLPALHPGVIIHVHDVFLPNEYPKHWITEQRRFWNEQYLLRAFLMYNPRFEVLFANSYMAHYHLEAMQEVFPKSPWWGGGSFWMRKRSSK